MPDLLAVLDTGLAVLVRCKMLERPVNPYTENNSPVHKVPVLIFCWRLLRLEPVVIVMLRLPLAPLLGRLVILGFGQPVRLQCQGLQLACCLGRNWSLIEFGDGGAVNVVIDWVGYLHWFHLVRDSEVVHLHHLL